MNRGGTAGSMFQDGCFVPGRVILLYKGSLCRGFYMPEILMFPAKILASPVCAVCVRELCIRQIQDQTVVP